MHVCNERERERETKQMKGQYEFNTIYTLAFRLFGLQYKQTDTRTFIQKGLKCYL